MVNPNLNLPNALTACRLLLTPFFIVALAKEEYGAALGCFTTAAVFDGLDGFMARRLNQRTTLGAYLDPVADKVLAIGAYTTLTVMRLVPLWLPILIIWRDLVMLFGIAMFEFKGFRVKISPSLSGKLTTVFQFVTVAVLLMFPDPQSAVLFKDILFFSTAGLVLISGFQYLATGRAILHDTD